MLGNPKTSYYIRIMVACYLLYISYGLLKGIISGEAKIGFIIAIIFFAACSIFFIVTSVKALSRISREEKEAAEQEVLENPVEEETQEEPTRMSISQRARLANDIEIPGESEGTETEQETKE